MKRIAEILAVGSLTLALALTGCGKQEDVPADSGSDTQEKVTVVDDGGTSTESTETAVKEATLKDLDGWWEVTGNKAQGNDGTKMWSFEGEDLADYHQVYQLAGAFKTNAEESTFELDTLGLTSTGKIQAGETTNEFLLVTEASDGAGRAMPTMTCRYQDDGSLVIDVPAECPTDDGLFEFDIHLTCARNQELLGKYDVTKSIMDREQELRQVDSQYYNALSGNDPETLVAEDDVAGLFMIGKYDIDEDNIMVVMLAYNKTTEWLIINGYLSDPISVNDGQATVDNTLRCMLPGNDMEAIGGQIGAIQTRFCSFIVPKNKVDGNLRNVTGQVRVTTFDWFEKTTLNFTYQF